VAEYIEEKKTLGRYCLEGVTGGEEEGELGNRRLANLEEAMITIKRIACNGKACIENVQWFNSRPFI